MDEYVQILRLAMFQVFSAGAVPPMSSPDGGDNEPTESQILIMAGVRTPSATGIEGVDDQVSGGRFGGSQGHAVFEGLNREMYRCPDRGIRPGTVEHPSGYVLGITRQAEQARIGVVPEGLPEPLGYTSHIEYVCYLTSRT